jgi:2-hydroxychromene-2-carboxylate isomerase
MTAYSTSTIDYYVWLMSDWAYLGGVRFVQMAARHGSTINHIPMCMQAAAACYLPSGRGNDKPIESTSYTNRPDR